MASRLTAESVLKKISQRHLECQICMDRFKEPKMLECSHSFCLECLRHLAEQQRQSRQKITCPVCRGQTLLTRKRVSQLRTDFKLTSLVDEIEHHETELQTQQDVQQPTNNQGSVPKCSTHTNKDVIMYCDRCGIFVCTTCIAKDHRMHPATELNEVLDNCKKKANKVFVGLQQHHIKFNSALNNIATSRKTLDSMFAATKAKISKKADEEIAKEVARIREEEKKMMFELDQIQRDSAKKIEIAEATNNTEIKAALNKKDEVIRLMDGGNFFGSLHLIEKLLQDLKEHQEIQPTKLSHGLTYIDLEDDQKSLGRLVPKNERNAEVVDFAATKGAKSKCREKLQQKTWTLKTEITRYMSGDRQIQNICASDVASFSNSDIVVCGVKNHTLVKILAESFSQSKVIAEELSIKGLINPSNVTVNDNDDLIVVDNRPVKIFDSNYQHLHQFTLGGRPFIQPSCIAVDTNNLIAVGYQTSSEISLHKPDGSHIRTLFAAGVDTHLTVHKQQLIYTNWKDNKLVSVDYNGAILFSVDIHQSKWPCGVCCDKDGRIYVAVCDEESSSGEIQCYSPDGQYTGCIIKVFAYPHGITLTPAGDLVVATHESLKIYHHK